MDLYQPYSELNTRAAPGPEARPRRGEPAPRRARPRIAVYTGGGSSHSWLWFVEIFQRLGLIDLSFVDQAAVARGDLGTAQVLAVSGGDTFGMAQALGRQGAEALEEFIRGGGLYLGSCAGAYLPLNSSKEPLNLFNWVAAKITNLSSTLPQARELPQKFCTPYGCSYVFHPVREAVQLSLQGREPFDGPDLDAPLYGGPAMIASDGVEVLATYQGFTDRTRFLVDQDLASQTLLGRAAVVRSRLGQGWLYLFGPHLEHPGFSQANHLVARAIGHHLAGGDKATAAAPRPKPPRPWPPALLLDLKRQVSNARITALGLEDHPARWVIGRKLYEPAKFRVFCEAVWSRLAARRTAPPLGGDEPVADRLIAAWRSIAEGLRALKQELDAGQDTQARAEDLFRSINRATADFMGMYFTCALYQSAAPGADRPVH